MVSLTSDSLDKEEARILAMRLRAQTRTHRFQNSRTRTMGIDSDFLAAQVEEKRQLKLREKQDDLDQAAYDQHILRVLEVQEKENREKKNKDMYELRAEQKLHASLPKNSCIKNGEPINPETCGPSAGQYFSGEDKNGGDRRMNQQQQMRQWTSQQIAEKNARDAEVKEDAMRYHAYLTNVDSIRGRIEDEESRAYKEMKNDVRDQNLERAKYNKSKKAYDSEYNNTLDNMEMKFISTDPFLNEETDYGKSSVSEYRVRPDHFKGFSKAHTMGIYKNNEVLVGEHKARKADEFEDSQAWAKHQGELVRQMEAGEIANKEYVGYMNEMQTKELNVQREEARVKREESKRDRFGKVSLGFFDGFGNSCR